MDVADLHQIARRFPLVGRPRPACPSLEERIGEISRIAHESTRADDPLPVAGHALNKAALIASDCGLPDLARELCWRHIDLYRNAAPLTVREAGYMLEPVVNLARLLIRSGDGNAAWELLGALHQAVRTNTDADIEGKPLPLSDLTGSLDEHRELCRWMWGVFLSEGTRALLSQGRWQEALAHVEQHKGIGQHLMDGRQVQIVARCLAGDPDSAFTTLKDSTATEPWEKPVAACLTVLCLGFAARPTNSAVANMMDAYLSLGSASEFVVFRTRLGLTVIDLASGTAHRNAERAATRAVSEAVAAGDGYVARDILAHDLCRAVLTDAEERALTSAVRSSGLDQGTIPEHLLADLLPAVETSEAVAARSLAVSIEL
ncbi:hypothetical protein ACFHYQ_05060 [Sphaerimonospora cavernae]|uniref:XRE family transcriptional regulator n=1 Tax=Sphaerimonospora cavernae TaxID=1740611 RepID=A0ABV6TZM7_9ACTN